jgi:uncharacterized protein
VIADDPQLLAARLPAGYRARALLAIVFAVHAWGSNCSQHVPVMFHAARAAETILASQPRVDIFTVELAELRARSGAVHG